MTELGSLQGLMARCGAPVETVFGFTDRGGAVERVCFDVMRRPDGSLLLAERGTDDAATRDDVGDYDAWGVVI